MSKLVIALGVTIVVLLLLSRFVGGWKRLHQRIIGLLLGFYGVYLATLTGTVTQFVIPGVGAVGGGAAVGAGIGFATWLLVGTIGVATGGVGLAIGAAGMAVIGGLFGAAGAAAGGTGFRTISYPLISPWFWGPVVILGIYLIVGSIKKNNSGDQVAVARPIEPRDNPAFKKIRKLPWFR